MTGKPERKKLLALGGWYAEVDGESLPCIHSYWFKPPLYRDPEVHPGNARFDELVAAIKAKRRAIMQKDSKPRKSETAKPSWIERATLQCSQWTISNSTEAASGFV